MKKWGYRREIRLLNPKTKWDHYRALAAAVVSAAILDHDWEFFFSEESNLWLWCGILKIDEDVIRFYAKQVQKEMMEERGGDYVTVKEVAKALGLTETSTLARLRKANVTVIKRPQKANLYPRKEVCEALDIPEEKMNFILTGRKDGNEFKK